VNISGYPKFGPSIGLDLKLALTYRNFICPKKLKAATTCLLSFAVRPIDAPIELPPALVLSTFSTLVIRPVLAAAVVMIVTNVIKD